MTTQTKVRIEAAQFEGGHRTGSLKATGRQIVAALGFEQNGPDMGDEWLPGWQFTVDGVNCAIWARASQYGVSTWSTYGPREALAKIFPAECFN